MNFMKSNHEINLLEINLISAQQLPKNSASMQTYVIAWIDPNQKLKSQIDMVGLQNPTWNDKFVFLVDDLMTIKRPNSVIVFEIFSVARFGKDKLVGSCNLLVDSLVNGSNRYYEGMRGSFRAVQIRGSSGEPYGILNIGFNILQEIPSKVFMNQNHNGNDNDIVVGKTLGFDHETLMFGTPISGKKERRRLRILYCFCGLISEKRDKVHQWRFFSKFKF